MAVGGWGGASAKVGGGSGPLRRKSERYTKPVVASASASGVGLALDDFVSDVGCAVGPLRNGAHGGQELLWR